MIRDLVLPLYRSAAAPFAPVRLVAAWTRHERVAREVDALGPDQLLLDVGCGQGPVARMLASRHRIVGVDLDLDSLEVFSRYGLAVAADARDLPFGDSAFDTALLGQSLNNMIEHDAVFAELARVIRRGGHLVLEHGMLADISLWPSIAFWWARRHVRSRSEDAYPVTRRPWRHTERSIVSAGFRVVQRIPLEISTGPLASRRLERAQAVVACELPKLASQQLVVAVRE